MRQVAVLNRSRERTIPRRNASDDAAAFTQTVTTILKRLTQNSGIEVLEHIERDHQVR